MQISRRNLRRATLALGGLALAITTAACSSEAGSDEPTNSPSASSSTSSSTAATGASARVGSIEITGAFIRKPVRPVSAAAYMVIKNSGDADDTLVKVTTDVTPTVEPMKELITPDGKKGMQTIPTLVIPAKGSVEITPGHKHLMLMNQNRELKVGETVQMTLTFAKAGTVTITLPIRPLVAAEESVKPEVGEVTGMPGMSSGSMSGMPSGSMSGMPSESMSGMPGGMSSTPAMGH